MRTLKNFMLLIMVAAMVNLTSCSSSDDGDGGDGGNNNGNDFLTAKVDGADFTASQNPADLVSAVVASGILTLQGSDNDGNAIRITINNYTGVSGSPYTTGDNISNVNSMSYIELPANGWTSTFDVGMGTLNITSDDGTTVAGDFSFTGLNASDMTTKDITMGSFSATIE